MRSAYETAENAGAVGPVLHRLFRQALHVGKRVRRETSIGENPASVSSAAAELAARVFDDIEKRSVLLVGAGKMGELAARNLRSRGVERLCVANRSAGRAAQLAERLGARAVELAALGEELERADIVISATGSQGLVLTVQTVKRALQARRGRPIFFVDIAVPRDLDPAINDLEGATCTTSTISTASSGNPSQAVATRRSGRVRSRTRRPRSFVPGSSRGRSCRRSLSFVGEARRSAAPSSRGPARGSSDCRRASGGPSRR